MARLILRLANGLISAAVALVLAVSGLYAGYALWDNHQIGRSAETVQSDMADIRDQALGQARTEAKPAAAPPAREDPEEPEKPAARAETEGRAERAEPEGPEPRRETGVQTTDPETGTQTADTEVRTETGVQTASPEIRAEAGAQMETAGGGKQSAAEAQEEKPEPGDSAARAEPGAQAEPAVSAADTPAQPEEPEGEMASLFRRLKEVNPDIGAWITMPDTGIDHPVVQGKHAFSYLSTDVYGNFAIAGSIFLDNRNASAYTDTYNLLYGHNMSEHRMFSDVNLYKEEAFFRDHPTGTLYLPDGIHTLQTLAVLVTPASNSTIFNPVPWNRAEGDDILRMVQEDALHTNETGLEALRAKLEAGERPRIVALSTCSGEYTDARTILLTLLE